MRAALLVVCLLSSACDDTIFGRASQDAQEAGDTAAASGYPEGWEGVEQVIVEGKCQDCHGSSQGSGFAAMGLDLVTEPCWSLRQPSNAWDSLIVVPGDFAGSVLWHKVLGSGVYGGQMPVPDREPLTEEQVAVIEAWIEAGAVCGEEWEEADEEDEGDDNPYRY